MWPFSKSVQLIESGIFQGMTDCHSHLLPGVDDGVEKLETTLAILQLMEEEGVKKVWLTPHIMEDIPNRTDELRARFAELMQQYRGKVELSLAAEYMLDNLFDERLANDDILPLREGKNYLLVETSYFTPPIELLATLKRVQAKGFYPLLAHPERYMYMRLSDYTQLRNEGIEFQLNLFSLVDAYGKEVRKRAEWLLKNGHYSLCGGDTHRKIVWQNCSVRTLSASVVRQLSELIHSY